MSLLTKAVELATSTEQIEREALQRFGANARAEMVSKCPVSQIYAPDSDNHRFAAGQVIAGVTLKGDLRNIAGMADEIRQFRGIQTPLVGVRRPDGLIALKQGFRRFNGVLRIMKDDAGSPLATELANGIPILVYSGLTAEQERTLVNDQTSKPFSKAEVWNIFREELRGGRSWLNICTRMYRQIGQVTGSLDKVRQIDAISDPKEREKTLRLWLLSFAFQGWVKGMTSGPLLEDMWLQTYLFQDKYEGANRPAVVMDTTRQKALSKQIDEDMTAGEWNAATGRGKRFDVLFAKYAEEDNKRYDSTGKRIKADTSNVEKLRPLKELQDLVKMEEPAGVPTLLSAIYRISLKDGGNVEACNLIRNFDKCRQVYLDHKEYMPDQLRETLGLIFNGMPGSEDTLMRICLDNLPVAAESTPVVAESTPVVAESTPVVAESTPVVAESAPVVAESAPVVAESEPTVTLTPTEDAGEVFSLTNETTEHPGDSTKGRSPETGKHKSGKKQKQNS